MTIRDFIFATLRKHAPYPVEQRLLLRLASGHPTHRVHWVLSCLERGGEIVARPCKPGQAPDSVTYELVTL